MAKIKVKQIEDLSLANSLLTVGAGKVEFSGAPTDGGYVSGFGIVDGIIKPTFTALPAADIFSTGLSVSTPDGATEPRTIKLDDAYVRTTVIGLTTPTAEPTESNTFVTGITYDNTTGKFAYTTGTTVAAKDGKLSIAFANTGMTVAGQIFSANEGTDKTLTLAAVAGSGKAEDVTIADAGNLLTATTVEAALAELAQKTTEIAVTGQQAIDVVDAGEGATGKVVSLKIAEGEQVLSQDNGGLKTELDLTYDTSDKKIKLWGISDETPIAEVDATDFIKDGMLDDAEIITATNEEGLTAGHRYIKFTFKTYQQGQEGQEEVLKVEYLDVEDLFDVYTSGNEWIEIDQSTNKISHKITGNGAITFTGTNNDTASTPQFGETVEISIPTFTVDAAGHVTSKPNYTTAKFTLPTPEAAATYYQHYDSYELTATDETNGYVNLTNVTSNGTPVVYLNGQSLVEGAGKDYTYSGTTINVTLEALGCDLEEGDVLTYSYINTTAPTA